MQRVTITLRDETVESLECVADREYGGNRQRAVRKLLDDWLDRRS